jgi:hypothetical protein
MPIIILIPDFPIEPSLMEQLDIPLSQQAGKWLVIRRRPESSHKKYSENGQSKSDIPLSWECLII